MKIEKEFAPVTIKIETREEYDQFINILVDASRGYVSPIRDHAFHLLKMLKMLKEA